MCNSNGKLGFVFGAVAGAAVGAVAGLLLAPQSGEDTRAIVSKTANDAWGTTVDTYKKGVSTANAQLNNLRPQIDATSDELRAKVDAARERMDKLRSSLSDTVVSTAAQVQSAVDTVSGKCTDGSCSVKHEVEVEPVEDCGCSDGSCKVKTDK